MAGFDLSINGRFSGVDRGDRAGGLGRVSPVQMLVFGTRHKQGYPPRLPTWAWDAIEFLVAPTARLFGVHVYYPPRGSVG